MSLKLLYICTHNRCRSILAEAITNHHSNGRIQAASAGSQPAGEIHPLTLQFLNERGIGTQQLNSQSWDLYETFKPNAVIYMCDNAANESCPTWFQESDKINWSLKDPSITKGNESSVRTAFNETINTLESRIKQLLTIDLSALEPNALSNALNAVK